MSGPQNLQRRVATAFSEPADARAGIAEAHDLPLHGGDEPAILKQDEALLDDRSGSPAIWLLAGGIVLLTLATSAGARFGVLIGALSISFVSSAGGLLWLFLRDRARRSGARRRDREFDDI